jgi:hypothetical protein
MGRRWLAVAATALVTGAYAAQVVVPAAETSPAPIAGTAPSYGPKSVSRVPNAAATVRRIWSPELDAGYDPQGLAVDDGAIYVSGYRSDSLGVRRGPGADAHKIDEMVRQSPERAYDIAFFDEFALAAGWIERLSIENPELRPSS